MLIKFTVRPGAMSTIAVICKLVSEWIEKYEMAQVL